VKEQQEKLEAISLKVKLVLDVELIDSKLNELKTSISQLQTSADDFNKNIMNQNKSIEHMRLSIGNVY